VNIDAVDVLASILRCTKDLKILVKKSKWNPQTTRLINSFKDSADAFLTNEIFRWRVGLIVWEHKTCHCHCYARHFKYLNY